MSSSTPYPPIIDVHTHVFNARYLPLKNILLSSIDDPGWFVKWLAGGVAKLLEESTGSSYGPRIAALSDRPLADQLLDEITARVANEFAARVDGVHAAAATARPADEAAYIADRLADDPMMQALNEVELALDALESPDAVRFQVEPPEAHAARIQLRALQMARPLAARDRAVALDSILQRFKRAVARGLAKLWSRFDKAMAWWDTIEDYLTFVSRLLMAEREIFNALREAYKSVNDVTLVHLMMDMQYAYDPPDPPRYPFDEQVRRMRRLAEDSGGVLLGFTAFHPRRCKSSFKLPDGFYGVKFYPAMGYRPAENDDPEIEESVNQFFRVCRTNDTPVFAHCTPRGFEARRGWGLNAHPKYWAVALKKHPDLRLCLGHAGGGAMENSGLRSAGWYARDDAEWNDPGNFAAGVVDLCRRYEHVYCEFGHLDALIHGDGQIREAFEANFVREWKRDEQSSDKPYLFAKKSMFGTDHHMAKMINHVPEFLEYFRSVFERHYLEGFEDFCSGTARRFLKLEPVS